MKELYIEEYERLRSEAEEQGLSEAEADEYASDKALAAMTDRVADMIDRARQMKKDGMP